MGDRTSGRVAAIVGTALALLTIGLTTGTAQGRAIPGCPPRAFEGDCYLLERVDSQLFEIPPGAEDRVIAQGKEACDYMTSRGVGPLEYGAWFARQNGGGSGVLSQAAAFANFAAVAYCRSVL